jgi:prevent-host-death family protein
MAVVNVAEARRRLADLLTRVAHGGERVIVERHGKPLAAWISLADFQRLEALERDESGSQERWREALDRARASRARILGARQGLPLPDSADSIRAMREERLHELAPDLR